MTVRICGEVNVNWFVSECCLVNEDIALTGAIVGIVLEGALAEVLGLASTGGLISFVSLAGTKNGVLALATRDSLVTAAGFEADWSARCEEDAFVGLRVNIEALADD